MDVQPFPHAALAGAGETLHDIVCRAYEAERLVADMYPVAHTLTLGTTIVSIVEIAFEETSASSMPPAVFELDGELLGAHVADAAVPPVKPVNRAPRLSDTDATALALDALLELDRVGALLGEQISITRSPGSSPSRRGPAPRRAATSSAQPLLPSPRAQARAWMSARSPTRRRMPRPVRHRP